MIYYISLLGQLSAQEGVYIYFYYFWYVQKKPDHAILLKIRRLEGVKSETERIYFTFQSGEFFLVGFYSPVMGRNVFQKLEENINLEVSLRFPFKVVVQVVNKLKTSKLFAVLLFWVISKVSYFRTKVCIVFIKHQPHRF